MSIAPNLCCDETKNQGTYTRVTHRFEGSDLIDRVPEEPRTKVHNIVQEAVIKTIPKKKKWKKAKWLLKKPYKWLRKEEKQKAKEESK